jgi:ATP-citrate lyase beta-subunit
MAQRGIREVAAKKLLSKNLPEYSDGKVKTVAKIVLVDEKTSLEKLAKKNKWLKKEKLVVKPDQLFGKRGKHGLVLLNASFDQAKKFLKKHMNKQVKVGKAKGKLTHFLVEPFAKHDPKEEYYIAIKTDREGDTIFFSTAGGVNVEENWDKVKSVEIPVTEQLTDKEIEKLLKGVPKNREKEVKQFIKALFKLYADLGFAYLEINPFTFTDGKVAPLDMVAKLDDTAAFENTGKWEGVDFPTPFGRTYTPEESYIKRLDAKSGASLKLTVLNPKGRVWTMVAGGGASVIYTDTIVDLGYGKELANYGEYSGNPKTEETYEYAKTILDLMTREKHSRGKVLIIGGGIANFTDVANTFKGIIHALRDYQDKLKKHKVKIYVRRGGPNYQEGLRLMRELGKEIGVPIEVYGPEAHITSVVPMALGKKR